MKKICGAKRQNKDKICKSPPMPNGKCRFHGGATPSGPASANWKHGKYSNFLPQHLRGSYEEAVNDPDLLRLKSEIALAETRRQNLMGQLDKGSHEDFIALLSSVQQELKVAIVSGDISRIRASSNNLDELIEKKLPDDAVWRRLMEIEDHKRKLVESERKRNVELGQLLTMEQSFLLIKRLAESVKNHVTDPMILKLVIKDINLIQGDFEN